MMSAGGEFRINLDNVDFQSEPKFVALGSGGYMALWQHSSIRGWEFDREELYAQRFDSQSRPIGDPIHINQTTAGSQSGASIAKLSNGNIVISWTSGEAAKFPQYVYFRLFDSHGNPISEETQANNTLINIPYPTSTIATTDGGFFITWTQGAQLYGRQFDANGFSDSVDLLISSESNIEIVATQNGFASVHSTYDTNLKLYEVKFQLYNNGWLPQDAPILTKQSSGYLTDANISKLSNGDLLVSWKSYQGYIDRSATHINFQHYDQNGNKIGDELTITPPIWDLDSITIIPLNNSDYLVTWTVEQFGVYAQKVDSNDTPIGSPFRVSSEFNDFLTEPNGISLTDGSYVIGWADGSFWFDENNPDVYAKHFINDIGNFDLVDKIRIGDAGDTLKTATSIDFQPDPKVFIEGSVGLNTDQSDFYQITIDTDTPLQAKLSHFSADLALTLWTESGELLAQSDNAETKNKSLDLTLSAPQSYIIQVSSNSDSATSYQLSLYDIEGFFIDPNSKVNSNIILANGDISNPPALVTALFYGSLGRLPDDDGFYYFINNVDLYRYSSSPLAELFLTSDEFISMADRDQDLQISNAEFLNHMYNTTLQRSPDQEGYQWWLSRLESGEYDQAKALVGFINSNEHLDLAAPIISAWSGWDTLI